MKTNDLKLNLNFLHYVRNQVFNLNTVNGEAKSYFDPIAKRYVLYGSAGNVKHCIVDYFNGLCENDAYKRIFVFGKAIKDKNGKYQITQGGVATKNILSIGSSIFGAWDSNGTNNSKETNNNLGGRISSILNVGGFNPVHPNLVSTSEDGGVHSGDSSSEIEYTFGNEKFSSIEDFCSSKSATLEDFESVDSRPMNIYGENAKKATGLYANNIVVDLSRLGVIDLSEFDSSEALKADVESKCEEFGCKVVDERYLVYPEEIVLECWEMLVESLFSWDFTSHRSLHGEPIEHLRVAYSFGNAQFLNAATTVKLTDESTVLEFNDAEVKEFGVKCFNSKLLEAYHNTEANGMETSILALEKAKKELLEEGRKKISENIQNLFSK